jgi:hypothetical protein
MIREVSLLLLIVISLQVLIRFTLYEGFTDIKRLDNRKQWEKLSNEQVLELLGLIWGPLLLIDIIDNKQDSNIEEVAKDVIGISTSIISSGSAEIFNNQSDINSHKNKIKNKAAGDKNLSVVIDVAESHYNDIFKLGKRFNSENRDQSDVKAIIDDAKELAKKGISEIRKKLPNFPFNPRTINQYPELFVETPKPTATDCKRYFKCSSIYSS